MYCHHCGSKNDHDAKFCEKCGSALIKEHAPVSVHSADTPQDNHAKLTPASSDKRLINFILDFIFVYVFAYIFGAVIATAGLGEIIHNMNETLLGYLIYFIYYLLFEGLFTKSVAKFITKTTVVSIDGSKPDFWQIFGRTLARFIPFEPFSFFGKQPIGWHDRLSGTVVINDKQHNPN